MSLSILPVADSCSSHAEPPGPSWGLPEKPLLLLHLSLLALICLQRKQSSTHQARPHLKVGKNGVWDLECSWPQKFMFIQHQLCWEVLINTSLMFECMFEPFASSNMKGWNEVFDNSCYLHDCPITAFFCAPLSLSAHLFEVLTVCDITADEQTLLD